MSDNQTQSSLLIDASPLGVDFVPASSIPTRFRGRAVSLDVITVDNPYPDTATSCGLYMLTASARKNQSLDPLLTLRTGTP